MDEDATRSVLLLRETCVSLLNQVQTSGDVGEKLQLLSRVQEMLLHQLHVVDETSEQCLKELVSYVGQLVADPHQEVKKWTLLVLCDVVKEKDASLIPQAVEAMYRVMTSGCYSKDAVHLGSGNSSHANLLKSCVQALTDVFPLLFQRVCFFADAFRVTWQNAMTMKDMICQHFLTGDHEGLRTHAIKFMQTFIMVSSRPPPSQGLADTNAISDVDIHADRIPEDHPYLLKGQLMQEAQQGLDQVLSQVHSKTMSSGNILAILNAMGALLKNRPQYVPVAMAVLLPLQKNPPLHLTPLQIKSLHHTLKLLLQSLLKLPSVESYRASIHEVWSLLAGKTTTKTTIAKFAVDRRALTTTTTPKRALPSSEEEEDDTTTATAMTADMESSSKRQRMHVDPELQRMLFHQDRFPYPFVLDLVMISMLHLPTRMPGYVSQHMTDMANRRALLLASSSMMMGSHSGGDSRKDPRKMDSRLQTRAPMTAAMDGSPQQVLIRTPTGFMLPLQSLAADMASFGGRSDEDPMKSVAPMEVIHRIIGVSHALKEIQGLLVTRMAREEQFQRQQQQQQQQQQLQQQQRRSLSEKVEWAGGEAPPIKPESLDETARRARVKPFVLQVTDAYSFEKLTMLLTNVFERLISPEAEQLANDTGGRKAWMTLICKLITTDINDSIEIEHLKDLMRERLDAFILENFKEHYDLAMIWLYHEYAADEQRKAYMVKEEKKSTKKLKYPIYFMRLLHGLKRSIEPNDKIFTRYVLDVPDLRETDLEVVREFCEDSERMALGLATLRDLVIQRSHSREPALRILLDLCVQSNKSLRTAAILVVKKWVPGDTSYSVETERFASQHLDDLMTLLPSAIVPADEASKMTVSDTTTAIEDEITRRLELYLALSSKKPELFEKLVQVYVKSHEAVQKVIRLQSYGLIKLFGAESPPLLSLLRDPSKGAETLALRILLVLTDRAKPTHEIVTIVKRVFEERQLDARFLIPVLGSLERSDVVQYLPRLIKLPKTAFEQVVQKLVVSEHGTPAPMDATDLLVMIHLVDPSSIEHTGLAKIKDATQVCLDMKEIFKQEVLAAAIQRLVDHTPLPALLMRTLIQTANMYPALINFLNHTVTRLIIKKIWTLPQLWEGFIKYCQVVKYHAAGIVLQLPKSQALEVFKKAPDLRIELERYFATHATHQLCGKFNALVSKSHQQNRPSSVPHLK